MSQEEDDLIHTFNGISFTTRSSPELLKSLVTFDAREDDVLLVSYPKSGTHWLSEIIMHLYASEVALTSPIEFGDVSKLEQLNRLSCKRIIPTHLDGNMLPPTFWHKQSKAIYIIRNPKDIAVSMYHYYRANPNLPTIDSWPHFLEMFLQGDVVCGSWFEHVLSWEEHRNDKNTLFLYYEDMKKDPCDAFVEPWGFTENSKGTIVLEITTENVFIKAEKVKPIKDLPAVVKKVGAFLGVNTNESGIREICEKSSFSEMKTNTEKENHDPNHTVCALTSNRKLIFRKGAVGDWKNNFTPKQNRMFEEKFNKKMAFSEVAKHLVYEC